MLSLTTFHLEYRNYTYSLDKQVQAGGLEDLPILSLKINKIEEAKNYCQEAIKLLEIEDNGIIRARLYRLMDVILYTESSNHSYYFLRMSYDLLKRLNSKYEASISLSLLEEFDKKDIKSGFF